MKIKCSFDDGTVEDLKVAELLKKYNLDAIFYFPAKPNYVNEPHGRVSLNDHQRQLIAKYFEIGSHTVTHPLLTRVDEAKADAEIRLSKTLLENEFEREITSFCYPRGYANPAIQQMVIKAEYTNARSTLVGYIHESENPFFEQTTVHVGCNRNEYGGQSWFEYALRLLADAKATKDSVYHLWGHSWEIEKNQAWEQFELLLSEVAK